MSREIDRLAPPASKKKMKLVVASCSRTGTMGLHSALKILGYTPYHMVEVLKHGVPHMKVAQEAFLSANNRFSGIKRYERAELDKWFDGYDCVLELPSYLGPRAIEAYIEDPDIKFILTERDPAKWARSFSNTAGYVVDLAHSFPTNILKHFDSLNSAFLKLNEYAFWSMSDGTNKNHPNTDAALRNNYAEYIKTVKERLPKDRTLIVKLEDGLGWEQICPFLDVPIPDEPYPDANDQDNFQNIVGKFMHPGILAAWLRLGALAVPSLGVMGFLGWRFLRS
ncbi:hypothetical protein PHISCL_08172 [Aspergillus sclerotialis]|uniref:P-loop containing nucleoside triphosphate hydrolase protein n=1 Tax=Aspergillus sclerotialis TaxID=2070753 RepID=A0A3A2ZDT1_9EURO|nr:hypothetical protein PHISCL_08172 [Aspergillus sclerotialis]